LTSFYDPTVKPCNFRLNPTANNKLLQAKLMIVSFGQLTFKFILA
jgi:hypothetical protein